MKTIKMISKILFFSLLISLLIQCKKETIDNTMSFGNIQTNFKVDSVYKASSDGFLYLSIYGNVEGLGYYAKLYSDNTLNPTTTIGMVFTPGDATFPIKKNNYWKVTQYGAAMNGQNDSIQIKWTPIVSQ
jgi:hypothetical protein